MLEDLDPNSALADLAAKVTIPVREEDSNKNSYEMALDKSAASDEATEAGPAQSRPRRTCTSKSRRALKLIPDYYSKI